MLAFLFCLLFFFFNCSLTFHHCKNIARAPSQAVLECLGGLSIYGRRVAEKAEESWEIIFDFGSGM